MARLRQHAAALLTSLLLFPGFCGCRAQTVQPTHRDESRDTPPPPAFVRHAQPPATHRFWAAKHWFAHNLTAGDGPIWMYPEPLAIQTRADGLLVGSSRTMTVNKDSFVHPIQPDFVLSTTEPRAAAVTVTQETDRMVEFDFGSFRTRVGRGMPFVYLTGAHGDVTLSFTSPPQVFADRGSALGIRLGSNTYGLFCPTGGRWTRSETRFVCHAPSGRHYFSAAVLPAAQAFDTFAAYAFTFPVRTGAAWHYDEAASEVTTTFTTETKQEEGRAPSQGFVQALYPHQYTTLTGPAASTDLTWVSARGELRLLQAGSFTTRQPFYGVLPFLPLPTARNNAEQRALLASAARQLDLAPATDTYNKGKALHRIAELLPLTQAVGDPALFHTFADALQAEFAQWQAPGERQEKHFVYDRRWHTLIGYPAAFGSNTQLNDHHFHYGYWVGTAALIGLYDPAWLNLPANRRFFDELSRDIANVRPEDTRYPLLRHFDSYAGHAWASGQAPFGDGQNEESSSEAVNAWAALILYATETGDRDLRDAAVWMFTLETAAARDYWFNDGPVSTFPAGFHHTAVANLFDGKADAATWFGDAPEFEHGIEFLPFTGASLYLGHDPAYVAKNLDEVKRASGGRLRTGSEFWPDLMEMYEALQDPRQALAQWRTTAFVFDGETKAHELAWLTSLNAFGQVDASIRADTPFYAVFRGAQGRRTHLACNPGASPLAATFTDGFRVSLPARTFSVESMVRPLAAAVQP